MWRIVFLPAKGEKIGEDSGEGPFRLKQDALDFLEAEVGVPAIVVKAPARRKKPKRRPRAK